MDLDNIREQLFGRGPGVWTGVIYHPPPDEFITHNTQAFECRAVLPEGARPPMQECTSAIRAMLSKEGIEDPFDIEYSAAAGTVDVIINSHDYAKAFNLDPRQVSSWQRRSTTTEVTEADMAKRPAPREWR